MEVQPLRGYDDFHRRHMTYYPDLSAWDYFGSTDVPLVAIGWLENGRPVPTGEVPEQVFEQLRELLREPWGPGSALGWHDCDLCVYRYGPSKLGTHRSTIGFNNVFVPGDAKIYVAPELILHYIDRHGYSPPAEFQQAVLDCPTMRSVAYLQAILKLGLTHKALRPTPPGSENAHGS